MTRDEVLRAIGEQVLRLERPHPVRVGIDGVTGSGKTILLLKDQRLEDGHGRLLRYIFLEDGTSVDATLVAEGFAEAWQADGYYRDQIVGLEEQAKTAGRGCLWGE